MIEILTNWLAFLGWTADNLLSIAYGAAAATAVAWVVKYPLRVWCESKAVPIATFKWAVRTITGVAAMLATWLTWPVRGRLAWMAGLVAWVAVTLLYRYSMPIATRYAPWLSSDHVAPRADDTDDAGA